MQLPLKRSGPSLGDDGDDGDGAGSGDLQRLTVRVLEKPGMIGRYF